MGYFPPPLEIRHLTPAFGKGRTKTSSVPDSLDEYAIHFPSGEKVASTSRSGPVRKGSGLPGFGCSGSLNSSGSVRAQAAGVEGIKVTTYFDTQAPPGENASRLSIPEREHLRLPSALIVPARERTATERNIRRRAHNCPTRSYQDQPRAHSALGQPATGRGTGHVGVLHVRFGPSRLS